jgi:thymidylate kinase
MTGGHDSATATTPLWVSVEGINGVGKTRLVRRAAPTLGDSCHTLAELPDTDPDSLPGTVIAALHQAGDLFLRTGRPKTETLLLLGLAAYRRENRMAASRGPHSGAEVVLEDRGLYSIAVYQAAILTGDAGELEAFTRAAQILDTATPWIPPPDQVLLLRDDPDACRHRFEQRIGRAVTRDERALMERAHVLYGAFAGAYPDRFTVLDRRDHSDDDLLAATLAACRPAPAVRTEAAVDAEETRCAR